MTYTGKLYGRLGGVFVETGYHSSDVDELTAAVKRLETENARFREALVKISNKMGEHIYDGKNLMYAVSAARSALTEAQHAS
jgi:hypothetical protein